jgi:hypothetical protein
MTAHQVRPYGRSMSTRDRRPTPGPGPSAEGHHPVPEYEIRLAGHLAPHWSTWFDGLTVTSEADGTTVLRGPVIDQAALHGLLQRLRDIGIPLIALTQIPSTTANEPSARPNQKEN